jgi:hypothetical protein
MPLLDPLFGSDGVQLLGAHAHLVSYFRATDSFASASTKQCVRARVRECWRETEVSCRRHMLSLCLVIPPNAQADDWEAHAGTQSSL